MTRDAIVRVTTAVSAHGDLPLRMWPGFIESLSLPVYVCRVTGMRLELQPMRCQRSWKPLMRNGNAVDSCVLTSRSSLTVAPIWLELVDPPGTREFLSALLES
jgi:hypothetical protein